MASVVVGKWFDPHARGIWHAHRHECLCHRRKSVATVMFERS